MTLGTEWNTEDEHERFYILPNGYIISFFFPVGKQWAIAFDTGKGKVLFLGKTLVYPCFIVGHFEIDRFVGQLEELL